MGSEIDFPDHLFRSIVIRISLDDLHKNLPGRDDSQFQLFHSLSSCRPLLQAARRLVTEINHLRKRNDHLRDNV
jgi:hypothetical protein